MTNARNLANLLGGSTTVPTTALPTNIQTLDVAEIPVSKLSLGSNVLTQSFDSNQSIDFNLTDSVNASIPIVSAFKEVPVTGVVSKGQWDVNANATNYDFFDEKPYSTYASSTLTPSATGDGTFTNSSAIVTPYILSNLSYDSKSFDAGAQLGNTEGIAFKSDGTAMYLIGFSNDKVWQYTLSTAYDISTASYSNKSFSVASQDGVPRDIRFKPDGTIMYIIASTAPDSVYQYTLSTAWDVSTASYANKSLNVQSQSINPGGLILSPDGTKVYVAGHSNKIVFQYNLSTAWDVSTGTYSTNSIDVSSGIFGHANPPLNALELNDDASKLFIGQNNYEIAEFSMPSDGDVSNASYVATYDIRDTGIGNQAIGGMTFANNGAKFYIFGMFYPGSGSVKQVAQFSSTASLAFNSSDVGKKVVGNSGSAIITATSGTYQSVTAFADTSAISSWQLFGAQGKADGSGIELSGYSTQNDIVFPTGASGSGASMIYSNNVSPTSSVFDNLRSVVFNNEGTIALLLKAGEVLRFNLSTAFDLSTMTEVTNDNFTVQLNSNQFGIAVKPDGTRIWVSDYSNDLIKQFTLSTPWSPSTQSYDGYYSFNSGGSWNSFSGGGGAPSSTNFNPFSFQFNSDGTKLLTVLWDNNPYHSIAEFTLSTGWDMSTMSYTSYANLVGNSDPEAIAISADGLKLMMHGSGLGDGGVEVYSLPSAFSVGSAGSNLTRTSGAMDLSALTGNSSNNITYGGLSMSSDGKRMWIIYNNNSGANPIYEITGGTTSVHPYSTYSPALTNSSNGQINSSSWVDINSMTADETKNDGDVFYAVSTDNRTSWGVAKGSDGVRKIARNNSGTWQYNNGAGTAIGFGISTPSYDNKSFAFTTQDAAPYDVQFNNNGTKMYMVGGVNNTVFQYTLSTAYDISTASYDSVSYSVLAQDSFNLAIAFNNTGTKMYLVGSSNDDIFQYTLSTAYDISTASYDSVSLAFPSNDSYPQSISFNSDGTKMYAIGTGNDRINQWTLSTAYDISTAGGLTYLGVVNEDNLPQDFRFNSDGTKLFLLGNQFDYIFQYTLSTAYDVSTASYDSVSYSLTGTPNPRTFLWNNDGTKFYILSTDNDTIYQYTSSSMLYDTSETWVNGTNNNEHATLQQALGAQSFNRMNKAQLDAVADAYHFSQDSADTLDLMIAPYAASGSSPISDGVTINYDAEAIVREAVNGTDYVAEFPQNDQVKIKSLINGNLKIRII